MTPPPGNPGEMLACASQLSTAGQGTMTLGDDTATAIPSAAPAWGGTARTAGVNLAGALSNGLTNITPKLDSIVTAIRQYAPVLQAAQDKVAAYNLYVADAAMAAGNDPGYAAQMQQAAEDDEDDEDMDIFAYWRRAAERARRVLEEDW